MYFTGSKSAKYSFLVRIRFWSLLLKQHYKSFQVNILIIIITQESVSEIECSIPHELLCALYEEEK